MPFRSTTPALITAERPDSPAASQLIAELEALLNPLYPQESRHGLSVEKLLREGVAFFVTRHDGQPAGCGGVQLFGAEYGEVKRMYVRPQFRGLGLGRLMLEHLADYCRQRGVSLLRLETGIHQVEAIGLYERFGFQRIAPFGAYRVDPLSVCFEKTLNLPLPNSVYDGDILSRRLPMPMDRSFVEQNRASTQRLRALAARLSDEQLQHPVGQHWTVAIALAHIAFWERRALHALDLTQHDGAVNWPDLDMFVNDLSLPFWAAVPPRTAANIALDTAAALDARLEAYPPALLQALYDISPRLVVRALHRNEHLDEVDEALKAG